MPSSSSRRLTFSITESVSNTESATVRPGLRRCSSHSRSAKHPAGRAGRGADLEAAVDDAAPALLQLVEQLLLEREQPASAAVEAQPVLGRLDAPPRAVEQLPAQALLQRPHLAG